MKVSLSFLSLLFLLTQGSLFGQEYQEVTDGQEDYWAPSERQLFEFFTQKYWSAKSVDHYTELRAAPLFVRLEDESKKIAALKKYGKEDRAEELIKKTDEQNRHVVSNFKERYKNGEYYFYYGKDAEAIFVDKDYSKLFTDFGDSATEVEVPRLAYVLIYRTFPRGLVGKAYALHIWDKNQVRRLKNYKYAPFLSFSSDYKDSIERFMRRTQPLR